MNYVNYVMPPSHFHGLDAGRRRFRTGVKPACYAHGLRQSTVAVRSYYGDHGRVKVALRCAKVLVRKY